MKKPKGTKHWHSLTITTVKCPHCFTWCTCLFGASAGRHVLVCGSCKKEFRLLKRETNNVKNHSI